ncbi:MAG: hypothetical protein P8182_15020 [Deltaproteobacteria bacterium]
MKWKTWVVVCACSLGIAGMFPFNAQGQQPKEEKIRDGVFEITLKTPDSRRIIVDELVRDRDLDPNYLYRVRTGGYLGFDEAEWVDKIEFKVFDIPVTEMPEYKKFANILSDINKNVWAIKEVLRGYNELSFRLMKICDKSKFPTMQSIDDNIAQQLSIYRQLLLLRSLVVNALERFVTDRSCVDRYAQYQKDLRIYTRRLTNLCKDFDRLRTKALNVAQTGMSRVQTGKQGQAKVKSAK